MIQIRLTLVSNSSSTSFVCGVCKVYNYFIGDYELNKRKRGKWFRCKNNHVICRKDVIKFGKNKRIKIYTEVDQEGFESDILDIDSCPICQNIKNLELIHLDNILQHIHLNIVPLDKVIQEMKEKYKNFDFLVQKLFELKSQNPILRDSFYKAKQTYSWDSGEYKQEDMCF